MTVDSSETAGISACTACAVALGADPVVAGLLAGIVALTVRVGLPALMDWIRSRRTHDGPAQ